MAHAARRIARISLRRCGRLPAAAGNPVTVEPGWRAGADDLDDAVQLARQFRAYGFTADDFDHFVDAFTTPDPAAVFTHWADTEHRPRIRRALIAALIAIEEAGR
jgi:hypothetical protein